MEHQGHALQKNRSGEHERLMRRCLALAEEALSRGDVPVGSLIVLDGRIIAEASERIPSETDITGHSELLAVRAAVLSLNTFDLSHCILYTTKEPCFMCSYAIRQSRISKVVIGAETTGVGGVTSSHPILTDPAIPDWAPPPAIIMGVLASESLALFDRYADV